MTRLFIPLLLTGLLGCNPERPPATGPQAVRYLDAEAVYMMLSADEPIDDPRELQRLTGRIQQLPPDLGALPWPLQLKARSEHETLAVEITRLPGCLDDATARCPATFGAALLRGQRVFLHCEQALATPKPQLRGCLLGTERLPD
ncbi:MAG: hypothetical protein M0Q54_03545 [Pigmentiphaga sp.]|nr:hypothetical protein [Pigmentiphaga sp.]